MMNSSTSESEENCVVYADPYCDAADPLWNTTFTWRTDRPDFTPCFQMTVVATLPCAFIILAFPFHFAHLRSTNRGLIPRSLLHVGKLVAVSFMLLLTLLDLGYTLWMKIQSDQNYAPVYLVTPILLHISLCLAGWLIHYERRRGCQSSACLWIFWFLLVVALTVPLRSYIHHITPMTIDERLARVKPLFVFVFYTLAVMQFLIHCFAEPSPPPSKTLPNKDEDDVDAKKLPCPEQYSSFLSRITFNWFFRLAWKGFRQPLKASDIWKLSDYDLASNIDDIFRCKWRQFGHYREVLEADEAKAEREKKKKNLPDLEVAAFLSQEKEASKEGENETDLKRVTLTRDSPDADDDFSVEIKSAKNANANNKRDNGRAKKYPFGKRKKEKKEEDADAKPSLWSVNRGGKRYLLNTLIRAFGRTILAAMFFKLVHDLLLFVPPYFLRLLIYYIRATHNAANATYPNDANKATDDLGVGSEPWKGYFFAVLLLLSCILQTIMLHQYFHRCILTGMWLRTALIAAIYRKSLNLSSFARNSTTVGEIVNLMSVDAQKFMDICTYLNMLWSAPLQIIIGIWMLWGILGPSTLAGIGVMILLMPINGCLANRHKVYQVAQMKLKDERIKMVNEVLNGMKVLKLYGWEPSFLAKMSDIRKKEVVYIKKMAILNAVSSLLWTCAPNVVSLATFYTYVLSDSDNVLDAEKTFVSVSYFNILRFPMSVLPMMISSLVQAYVSLKRINNFLRLEELDTDNVEKSDSSTPDALAITSDASFRWSAHDPVVLDHLEVRVKRGSLVAVVGPVGSGKSSLISAFLGNLHKISGRVSRDPSVAFVPQQPWIQNATLESNILFHSPMDEDWYERVVWASAMEPDLAMLPDGDQTEIGEKGINLSGGQKQRVSLARAVYSKREVYLLDDPLSAVDSHVGKHLFDQVIGPSGILASKTRLLVTHAVAFLDQVDYIYVVNEGVVTEHGTYDHLMAADSKFTEFIKLHSMKATEEGAADAVDETEKALSQLQMNLLTPKMSAATIHRASQKGRSRSRSDSTVRSVTHLGAKAKNGSVDVNAVNVGEGKEGEEEVPLGDGKREPKERQKLIQEESSEVGNVKMSVVKVYVRAVGVCLVVLGVSLFFTQQALDVGINIWLEDWSNEHEKKKSGEKDDLEMSLQSRLTVYAAMTFVLGVVVVCGSFAIAIGNIRASMKLHDGLAENILRSPMSFFDTVPGGRILNRFSKDIDTIDSTIPFTIRGFLGTFVRVLGTIFIVSYGTPLFLTVCPFLFLIYFFAQRFYIPASRQLKRLESTTRSPIYSLFAESIAGVSTIKAYDRRGDFISRIFRLVDENVACYFPNMVSNRWLAIRLELVGNSIMFFAALFAILNAEHLEPGTIGLTLSAAMQITQTLNWMVRMTSELENNVVSVERIKEYTDTPVEAPWRIEDTKPPSEWPVKADVVFDRLDLRYREGLELVLKGVSVDIKDGEKVGIVGRTGAGKSSLTLALFRLVELAGGKIEIDGVDASSIGLHDLRTKISIIPQDPVLFSGTLRMNLDPFDAYSDQALWEALEHAHLKDYVKDLADGLQHVCSEGGENLSVGQRQLVCLARALLRNSNILVLDEATAAVDLETDLLIQGTIRTKFSSSTILTIAHRLNTVMDYDKILVMSAGEVAQYDTPQNLLSDQNGIFYSMAKDANLA